jgi:hypothetical protein
MFIKMPVEPWEYGAEEVKKQKLGRGGTEFIYLAVLIVSVIIAYFYYSKSIIFWLAIGAAIGALIAIFSKSSEAAKIVYVIAVPLAIFLVITFMPSTLYVDMGSKLSLFSIPPNATSSLSCLFSYAQCAQQYTYDSSTIPSSSRNAIDASFQTKFIRENQPIDIDVNLAVFNQDFDNLVVDVRCYLDGNKITAQPSSFTFQKSMAEQDTVVTCKGDYSAAKKLSINLSATYTTKATLPISIGKEGSIGKQVSSMEYDSPYKLSISLGYDQPLKMIQEYKMPIVLEKQKNMIIQNLNFLKVSTQKDIIISCDDIPGNQITNLDRNSLKKYLIDPDKDTYYFRCSLNVAEIPETAPTAYIRAEAIYSAEANYETALNIIKT